MKLRDLLGFDPPRAFTPRSSCEIALSRCGMPVYSEVSTVDGQHYVDGKSIDVILEPVLIEAFFYNCDFTFILRFLSLVDNPKLNLKPACRGKIWATVLKKMYSEACPDSHTPRQPYFDIFRKLIKHQASLPKANQLPEIASILTTISEDALNKKRFDLIHYMFSEFKYYSYTWNKGPENGYDNRDLWDAAFKAVVMSSDAFRHPGSRSKEAHDLIVDLGKYINHSSLVLGTKGLARSDLYNFLSLIELAAKKTHLSAYDPTRTILMEYYNREHAKLEKEEKDQAEALLAISNQAQEPVVDSSPAWPQVKAAEIAVAEKPVIVHKNSVPAPKDAPPEIPVEENSIIVHTNYDEELASARAVTAGLAAAAAAAPPSYKEDAATAERIKQLYEELARLTGQPLIGQPVSNAAEPPPSYPGVTPLRDHREEQAVVNENPTPNALALEQLKLT